MRRRTVVLAAALVLAAAAPLNAQQAPGTRFSTAEAFGIELAGGAVGSAIGFGTVVLLAGEDACGEDIRCMLGNAALAVTMATAGSAFGAWGVGEWAGTEPSGAGAVVGAAVGAAAAIGLDHLLREELGASLGDRTHLAIAAVAQGALTALGSRIGAAIRRPD